MADKAVDWFAEPNRYAILLAEQELKATEATAKHRPQKIVANGAILADLVQVVRCKDCKHWSMGYCNHFAYYSYEPMTNEDDFCSYGERRKGE